MDRCIDIQNLSLGYGGRTVVNQVNISIPKGRVVAVVGPNGCGKSTLLRAVGRLHKPSRGTIRVNRMDIWKTPLSRVAKEVTLLPQYPTAPAGISVIELAGFGRYPCQGLFPRWSKADQSAVEQALDATGLTDLAHTPIDYLSGGQRQRAWLAMALAREAPVMLLDEPTSALDLGHQIEILSLVRSLADGGRTIFMVVHDLFSAARYADIVVAMAEGRIMAVGDPVSTIDQALVKSLYGVDADILKAPGDNSPLVVPKG